MDWMSPLVTSALRLVVITLLFSANCGAICRLYVHPKYKGIHSYKWITILTILILNITYLSFIWAPFTITTFKYNLLDLHQSNSSALQDKWYRRVLGEARSGVFNEPEGDGPRDLMTPGFDFDRLRQFENGPAAPLQPIHSRLGDSLNYYITTVQDIVTSSFTYSLILIVFMRKIISEKPEKLGLLQSTASALMLTLAPVPITIVDRIMTETSHQFAPHTSEVSTNGYTMFSIICDVNITQNYMVEVILESTMLLLTGIIMLVVTARKGNDPHSSTEEEEEKEETLQIEDVACKFVLLSGSVWAWPMRPVLITILFYLRGNHWNNIVCWLANMVVAVPVVFMPLAVFLSRDEKPTSGNGYDVLRDPENTPAITEKPQANRRTGVEVGSEAKEDICKLAIEHVGTSPVEKVEGSLNIHKNTAEKGCQARENLKFYLGTDIFKPKREDEVCILSTSSLPSDGNVSSV